MSIFASLVVLFFRGSSAAIHFGVFFPKTWCTLCRRISRSQIFLFYLGHIWIHWMGIAHILRSMVLIALLLGVLQLCFSSRFREFPWSWRQSCWGFEKLCCGEVFLCLHLPSLGSQRYGSESSETGPGGKFGWCPGCQWVDLKTLFRILTFRILPSRVS